MQNCQHEDNMYKNCCHGAKEADGSSSRGSNASLRDVDLVKILEVAVGVDHKLAYCGFVAGDPGVLVELEG